MQKTLGQPYATTTLLFLLLLLLLNACHPGDAHEQESVAPVITTTGNPAIDALSQEITKSPTDAELYALRAELFYENEGYDEAIADLNKALQLDSANIDYLHLLADAYLDYYRSKEALNTMERAAVLYPTRIQTLLKLSEFQFILKQYDASLKTLERILALDPQSAEAYFMSGMNFKEMQDIPRALNGFQTAVELDADLIDAWIELGILFDQQDNTIALRYFENALRIDSTNLEARLAIGNFHLHRGEYDQAIAAYRAITRLYPSYSDAYFNIGLAFLEKGDLAEAYKHFDIVVNLEPAYVMAYYYRGRVAEQQGDYSRARNDYQQALNLDPQMEQAKKALADLKTLD